jgi:thiol-disulfide isomerase/thioredoxin
MMGPKLNLLKIIFLTTLFYLVQPQSQALAEDAHVNTGFSFKDTTGKTHALPDYKGKWVFVNYWATWCPPCLEEIPDLVTFYDKNKSRNVMVIGVVFDFPNKAEVSKYVDDMLMSYPIVYGDEHVEAQLGVAEVLPTTFIFNPHGKLVKIKRGLVTQQYLNSFISNTN